MSEQSEFSDLARIPKGRGQPCFFSSRANTLRTLNPFTTPEVTENRGRAQQVTAEMAPKKVVNPEELLLRGQELTPEHSPARREEDPPLNFSDLLRETMQEIDERETQHL